MNRMDSRDITNIPARTRHQREREQLAIESRKQIARGIGMCAFWTGLILFVGYLNWVEQGRPK